MHDIEVTGQIREGMFLVVGKLLREPPVWCLSITKKNPDAIADSVEDVVFGLRDYEANGRRPHLHAKWTVGKVSGWIVQVEPCASFKVKDDKTGYEHEFTWGTKDDDEAIH